jgi:hypothetical protein
MILKHWHQGISELRRVTGLVIYSFMNSVTIYHLKTGHECDCYSIANEWDRTGKKEYEKLD